MLDDGAGVTLELDAEAEAEAMVEDVAGDAAEAALEMPDAPVEVEPKFAEVVLGVTFDGLKLPWVCCDGICGGCAPPGIPVPIEAAPAMVPDEGRGLAGAGPGFVADVDMPPMPMLTLMPGGKDCRLLC